MGIYQCPFQQLEKEMMMTWTVDLLARTCGVDPKTAGRALQELRDLAQEQLTERRTGRSTA